MMTAQIRFDHMHPLVEEKQKAVEDAGRSLISSLKDEADEHAFGEKVVSHVNAALATWQRLSDEMIVRFSDNSDIARISTKHDSIGVAENIASLDYPAWWLRAVGFTKGLPPPSETQCPPACPSAASQVLNQLNAMYVVASLTAMFAFFFVVVMKYCRREQQVKESVPYSPLS
jgi:hypothetical protein